VVAASGHKNYAVTGLGGGAAHYELYGKFANKHFVPAHMGQAPPLTAAERRQLTIGSPIPIGGEDAWAFQYTISVIRKVRPGLLMLNLPEVDTWGHWNGPSDAGLFRKLLPNIDRGVGAIRSTYQQLGILDRTTFIITSDHAMMDSLPVHDWTETVRTAAQAEHTSAARVDGTTGAIWLVDAGKAKAVAQRLIAARLLSFVVAIFYRSAGTSSYSHVRASPRLGLPLQRLLPRCSIS